MLSFRLTYRQLLVRRARTLLTLLAIGFAVSLVVAVTSGFASLSAVATKMMDRYVGTTDAIITARDVLKTTFPASVLDDVRRDPRVRKAVGRYETSAPLLSPKGETILGQTARLIGLDARDDESEKKLRIISGGWFEGDDGNGVVLNANVARRIKSPTDNSDEAPMLTPGDEISLPGINGPLKVRVLGVVHQPLIAGNAIYLPLRTLREWASPGKSELSRVLVELKEGKDLQAFESDWKEKLRAIDPSIRIKLTRTSKQQSERNLLALTMLSAVGVSISLVAAACIVFSTLSMGVAERQRQLAMLRAIGSTRSFIARMVVGEGLMLSLTGVAMGVPLGWLWVKMLTLKYPLVFTEGVVLSPLGVTYALVACVGTALVATLLPAWQAARVSPLEAMAPLASDGGKTGLRSWPWRTALAGVLLLLVDPLVLSGLPGAGMARGAGGSEGGVAVARGVTFWGHLAAGVPLSMIGFFLLSPLVIRLSEKLLGSIAARAAGLPPSLLRQQLGSGGSGAMWRAAGTACALMVGLATLVVMQTQGRSALGAWKLPDRFPDAFILAKSGGLNDQQVTKLRELPEIVPEDLMPIAIASPIFGDNFLAIAGAAAMPTSTLYFGLDPVQANRMTELEFRRGDRESATRMLKQGGHVLVTEEYRQIKNVDVGDTVELLTKAKGRMKFTIAGVVWSPGIDVIVSMFDLGGHFDQRTAYSVFGTLDDAKSLFGVDSLSVFAVNLRPGVDRVELNKKLQDEVGKLGLQAFDIRQIKSQIEQGLGNLLLMASSVAFAALFVASLGVTNTIMASVRSRRWQFGVLRAVGVTRSQLLRLVMAESLLLALAAAGLGLAAGAWMTHNARTATAMFVGFSPELVIPAGMIAIGVGTVLGVALLAAWWPARGTSKEPVLALLQAGRSAA